MLEIKLIFSGAMVLEPWRCEGPGSTPCPDYSACIFEVCIAAKCWVKEGTTFYNIKVIIDLVGHRSCFCH